MARKQKKTGTILSLGSNWSHTYQTKMQSFSISFVHVWLVYVQGVPPNPRPTCLQPALCLRWDHLNFQHRLGLPNRRLHREISKVGKAGDFNLPNPSSPKCNWIVRTFLPWGHSTRILPPLPQLLPFPDPGAAKPLISWGLGWWILLWHEFLVLRCPLLLPGTFPHLYKWFPH